MGIINTFELYQIDFMDIKSTVLNSFDITLLFIYRKLINNCFYFQLISTLDAIDMAGELMFYLKADNEYRFVSSMETINNFAELALTFFENNLVPGLKFNEQ